MFDRTQRFGLHGARVGIGTGGGQLYDRPSFDESGVMIHRYSGDLEVLQSPRCLDAVVSVCGDGFFAQQVALDPNLVLRRSCRPKRQ
jgi:hypothetical protein